MRETVSKMYDIFLQLMTEKGVRPKDVARATGVAYTSLTDWKAGRSRPKVDKLQKLADYFGVSVDYLLTGKKPGEKQYYLDDDVIELADFLMKNPEYKVLFDASRKTKKEDIAFITEMIRRANGDI